MMLPTSTSEERFLAQSDTSLERISSILVERGLYVLRYDSCADTMAPPTAFIKKAEGCEATLQIISAPGSIQGELPAPGSCLVVIAEAPGALHISMRRQRSQGLFDATLRLELLTSGDFRKKMSEPRLPDGRDSVVSARGQGSVRAQDFASFFIMGHVAHRGDVEVAPGDWIAGPDSPSPLEGLEIRNADSVSVSIETQALLGGRPPKWSDWASPNSFVGTRGQRLPIVGLRFRLRGPDADQYQLNAEALFLGAPIMTQRGRQIELKSAAGSDPLVGLCLALTRENAGQVKTPDGEPATQTRQPRVRIFRASEARQATSAL
jgi:hypothetical protein